VSLAVFFFNGNVYVRNTGSRVAHRLLTNLCIRAGPTQRKSSTLTYSADAVLLLAAIYHTSTIHHTGIIGMHGP
jgi:hypothetical protein